MKPEELLEIEQLRQHVIDELLAVGGQLKRDEIKILCPYHRDSNPSLGVHVGNRKMPGAHYCFSCRNGGYWNKLAHALRLKVFNGRFIAKAPVPTMGVPQPHPASPLQPDQGEVNYFDILDRALASQPPLETPRENYLKGTEDLYPDFSWRGLTRTFLKSLDASFYWDSKTSFEYLHFPLTMDGTYKGYTLCAVNKQEGQIKYQTLANTKQVLFLYDHIPQGSPIVLVEGHFDALRLFSLGIPAVAIFGTGNWSEIKRNYILSKSPEKVIILMDGDEAGYEAAPLIFNDLRSGSNVDIYWLPIVPGDKSTKIDPGNMHESFIQHLESLLWKSST